MTFAAFGRAALACAAFWFAAPALAQSVSITALNTPATQNFDTLANTGTTNAITTLPSGWTFAETGTGANTIYAADNGGLNTGNTYSYGSTGSTERAFGTLLSGSVTSTVGASFTNNTGTTITQLDIAYTGEQWRLGAVSRADHLDFAYSLDASNLSTGTWTPISSLTFTAPIQSGTVGALDGNAVANRTAVSASITGLSIAPGATIWIRWSDFNATSSDDGLAIDDFSLTAIGSAPPSLSIDDITLSEGDSGTITASFTVSLSAPAPASGVTFDIATADNTATTADNDYVVKALFAQTIPAGSTQYTFDVTINGDRKLESNETFFVNVTNVTGATLADGQGQGTIDNDDSAPHLSASAVVQNEGNAGNTLFTVTVTSDAPAPAGGIDVDYATSDDTAHAGEDYEATSGTLTIPENATSASFDIVVYGDSILEGNESFIVTLTPTKGVAGPASVVTVTITNDDGVTPQVSIADASIAEGDSGTQNLVFTVSSSVAAPAGGITVDYATADGTATTADGDYAAASGTAIIAEGASSTMVSVTINGDRRIEADETLTVSLSNATGGAAIADADAVGTITNDDVQPTLTVANASIAEGDSGTSTLTFTVSLSSPALEGSVSFTADTADGTATADSDYVALSGVTGNIAAGATSTTIDVTINGDTAHEPNETFALNLSAITGATNTTASATGTVTNDDVLPTLSVANASINEGNSGTTTLTFTVSLSSPALDGGVGFNIATVNGTATAGSDYVAISGATGSIAAGATSTTIDVTINGDTAYEPNETFTLNLTAITGATNTSASTTGTINNDDTLSIGAIQGDGAVSPFANQTVTIQGAVVTGVGAKGFSMQDPVGDGNPDTSDGIYVFTSSAPTVQVNDIVTVTGKVVEFSGTTEFTNSGLSVIKTGVAATPIAPLVLDDALPSPDPNAHLCNGSLTVADGPAARQWECLEGMLVALNDGVVTGATAKSSSTGAPTQFFATVGSQPRPFREKGLAYPGDPAYPTVPVWDGNPEIIEFYPPSALSTDPAVKSIVVNAGQHFNATGIVNPFGAIYEIYPVTFSAVGSAPGFPQPVRSAAAGTLAIGTQNMLRLFNDLHDSGTVDACTTQGSSDVCPTTAQFQLRLAKLSRQVREVLQTPAVLGVQEIENLATLQSLATQIHNDDPSLTYQARLAEGNDVGGIDVGLLVRSDVTINSVTQLGKNVQTNNCSGTQPCLLNDRPPLLLDASFGGYHFGVLVIHDRSLSSIEDPAKLYIRNKRLEQAQFVAEIAQAWQTGSNAPLSSGEVVSGADANAPLVIVGDYNAYEFTDGYADVTGQIKGTAVQSENIVWAPPITSPTLIDTGDRADPASRYSFSFDGYMQELDHILVTRAGWKDFVSVSNAHGNADVAAAGPEANDANTAARSADHDGQVVVLAIDRLFGHDFDEAP